MKTPHKIIYIKTYYTHFLDVILKTNQLEK